MPGHWPTSLASAALALTLPFGAPSLGFGPPPVSEQTPAAPPQAPAADGKVLVLPAGEHDLEKVADLVGAYLNYNILTEDIAQGQRRRPPTIELKTDLTLEGEQALDVLSELLWSHHYALTFLNEDVRLMEVVDMESRGGAVMTGADHSTIEEVMAHPNRAMPVVVTCQLVHINAQAATNSLRPFFAGRTGFDGILFGNVGNAQSLLVSGMQSRVVDAIRMLQMVDQPLGPERMQPIQGLANRIKDLEAKVAELQQQGR